MNNNYPPKLPHHREPNFSIALICKNEEKTLPRLLNSLFEFFVRGGEVIILDTGSTDNTVAVAKNFGCRVEISDVFSHTIDLDSAKNVNEHFVINNEEPILKEGDKYFIFSVARNYIDSFASNNMILSLDADEIMTKLDIDKICALIDDGYTRFEHMQVFTHDETGKALVKFRQSKFYDRRYLRWENITHEMLVGECKKTFLDENLFQLDHWQNAESNRSGYMRGLAIDCYLDPTKDRNLHYLGRELMYSNRLSSAEHVFDNHLIIDLPEQEYPTTPTHMDSLLFLGQISSIRGDIKNELHYYKLAHESDPTRREPVLRMAHYHLFYNNIIDAMYYASKALEYKWDERYGVSEEHYTSELQSIIKWIKPAEIIKKIPKRIYTIWIGPEMPELIKKCIDTQKIDGYEHILIDNSNYYRCRYVDECVSAKKWGKAADYLRMHYLQNGGIFLDADTEVLKPFDDVLDNEMFVCEEENKFIANGIVGVIPNHPMIKHYLEIVSENFIGSGDLVFQPGMYLWTELVKYSKWSSNIRVYPSDWFLPYNHQSNVTNVTENTHTMHFYLKSWLTHNNADNDKKYSDFW